MKKLFHALNHARVFHGWRSVDDRTVYFPSLDRWLYLSLQHWRVMGELERRVIAHFVAPGMHVIDVGANIGLYTLYFHKQVGETGKVTSLEPAPELRAALEKSLAKNHAQNVDILAFGAGSAEGSLSLSLDPWNSGNNWLAADSATTGQPQITVPVRRLDSLPLERGPDFVKIDVQGWEVEVLKGMSGWVEKGIRPMIFCEIAESGLRVAGTSTRALASTLCEFGYAIFLPKNNGGQLHLIPMTPEMLEAQASRHHYFDIIARAAH